MLSCSKRTWSSPLVLICVVYVIFGGGSRSFAPPQSYCFRQLDQICQHFQYLSPDWLLKDWLLLPMWWILRNQDKFCWVISMPCIGRLEKTEEYLMHHKNIKIWKFWSTFLLSRNYFPSSTYQVFFRKTFVYFIYQQSLYLIKGYIWGKMATGHKNEQINVS